MSNSDNKQRQQIEFIFKRSNDINQQYKQIGAFIRSSIKYGKTIDSIVETTIDHNMFLGLLFMMKYGDGDHFQRYDEVKERFANTLEENILKCTSQPLSSELSNNNEIQEIETLEDFCVAIGTLLLSGDLTTVRKLFAHLESNLGKKALSFWVREISIEVGDLLHLTDDKWKLLIDFWECACSFDRLTIPAQMINAYKDKNGTTTLLQEGCYEIVVEFLAYLCERQAFECIFTILRLFIDIGIKDIAGGSYADFVALLHPAEPRELFRGLSSLELLIMREHGDTIQAQELLQKLIGQEWKESDDIAHNKIWDKYYTYWNWYSLFRCIALDCDNAEIYIKRKQENAFFDERCSEYNKLHITTEYGINEFRHVEKNKYSRAFQFAIEHLIMENTKCTWDFVKLIPAEWNPFYNYFGGNFFPHYEKHRDLFNNDVALQKMHESLADSQIVYIYFHTHLKSSLWFEMFFSDLARRLVGNNSEKRQYINHLFKDYPLKGVLQEDGTYQILNVRVNAQNTVTVFNSPKNENQSEAMIKVIGYSYDRLLPTFALVDGDQSGVKNLSRQERVEELFAILDRIGETGTFNKDEADQLRRIKPPWFARNAERVTLAEKVAKCCHRLADTGKTVAFVREMRRIKGYPFLNEGDVLPPIGGGDYKQATFERKYRRTQFIPGGIPIAIRKKMRTQWDDIIIKEESFKNILTIYLNTPFKLITTLSYVTKKWSPGDNYINLKDASDVFISAKISRAGEKDDDSGFLIKFTPLNMMYSLPSRGVLDEFEKQLIDQRLYNEVKDEEDVFITLSGYDARKHIFLVDKILKQPPKYYLATAVINAKGTKKEVIIPKDADIFIDPGDWTSDEIQVLAPAMIDGLYIRLGDYNAIYDYLQKIKNGNPWVFGNKKRSYRERNTRQLEKARELLNKAAEDFTVEEAIYLYMNSPLHSMFNINFLFKALSQKISTPVVVAAMQNYKLVFYKDEQGRLIPKNIRAAKPSLVNDDTETGVVNCLVEDFDQGGNIYLRKIPRNQLTEEEQSDNFFNQ